MKTLLAASIMLSLATTSPAFAFSEPYHMHIGWPATLLCRQFSALKGNKHDVAIGWALGYTSTWQASRYEDARGELDTDTGNRRLDQANEDAVKPEEVSAFVERIEKKCRERPEIFFSDAVGLAEERDPPASPGAR
jgi:hypothetical protein